MRDYTSVIIELTINEENRLRRQVTQMKEDADSVNALSERLSSLESAVKNILVNSDTRDRTSCKRIGKCWLIIGQILVSYPYFNQE